MARLGFALPLLAVVSLFAQQDKAPSTTSADSPNGATVSDKGQSNNPPAKIEREQFAAGAVLVKYVAGTWPNNSNMRKKLLGKMGCLVSTGDGLMFVGYHNQLPISRLGGFFAHLVEPSWVQGNGQCDKGVARNSDPRNLDSAFRMDYGQMRLLARGQVQNMSSASGTDIQFVAGIGSIAGAAAIETTAGYIGLGTVAGTSIAYYLSRRTHNYITVFVRVADNAEKPKAIAGKADVDPKKMHGEFSVTMPKADDPSDQFSDCAWPQQCEFASFQVIDPHAYWNTSMLLNARTGATFVAEGTEKGGSGGDSSSK